MGSVSVDTDRHTRKKNENLRSEFISYEITHAQ
jgi:hypothetical protein